MLYIFNMNPLDQFEIRDLISLNISFLNNMHLSITNIAFYLILHLIFIESLSLYSLAYPKRRCFSSLLMLGQRGHSYKSLVYPKPKQSTLALLSQRRSALLALSIFERQSWDIVHLVSLATLFMYLIILYPKSTKEILMNRILASF